MTHEFLLGGLDDVATREGDVALRRLPTFVWAHIIDDILRQGEGLASRRLVRLAMLLEGAAK